jgi:hypothetical protein
MAKSTRLPCPHGGADAAAFSLMYYHKDQSESLRCFMLCNVCNDAIILAYPKSSTTEMWIHGTIAALPDQIKPLAIWPEPKAIEAPNGVPPNIASLYKQAVTSLRQQHYDAAGPVLRRINGSGVEDATSGREGHAL